MTPLERDQDRARANRQAEWMGLCSALFVGATALILMVQGVAWLKTGTWHSVSVAQALMFVGMHGWASPQTSWLGLDAVLTWLLDLHIGFALVLVGTIVGFTIGEAVYTLTKHKAQSGPTQA